MVVVRGLVKEEPLPERVPSDAWQEMLTGKRYWSMYLEKEVSVLRR